MVMALMPVLNLFRKGTCGCRYEAASAVLTAQKQAFREYTAVHTAKRVRINKHAPAPTAQPQEGQDRQSAEPALTSQTHAPAAARRALLTAPPVCGNGVCDAGESCG